MECVLEGSNSIEAINGRRIVKKHVAAIHSSNALSLLERKISNALLYNAFGELKTTLVHTVTFDKLKKLLGTKTRNHKVIKDALRKLISTVIEWNLCGDVLDNDLEGWNASSILSSVSINKGVVSYQYSELIKALLSDPAMYGKINLGIQSRFKRSYALALYENCARYRGLPSTKKFDLPLLRKILGIGDNSYLMEYKQLCSKVLLPSIDEINTIADFLIEPEYYKNGRKIIAVRFNIKERPLMKRYMTNKNTASVESGGANSDQLRGVEKLIDEFGQEQVYGAIKYLASKKGKINNYLGYLRTILVNKYEDSNESIKPVKLNKEMFTVGVHEMNYWQSYISKFASTVLRDRLLKMDDLIKNELEKTLLTIFNKSDIDLFDSINRAKDGLTNIIILDKNAKKITERLSDLNPELVKGLMTLEEYIDEKKQEFSLLCTT